MKRKASLGLGVFLLAGILGSGVYAASAYRGNPEVKGPDHAPERHEAMQKVFENKDYDAWKALMEERKGRRVLEVVNKDNFPRFVEMRNLMREGKKEESDIIRKELGLGQGKKKMEKAGSEQGKGRHAGKGSGFVDENGNGICDRAEN